MCTHLNWRGITRRGHAWGIGSLQDLMTSSTYCGRHLFNRTESRTGRQRPDAECVEMAVPAIISEEVYLQVRAALHDRSPRKTPPRVVNGPTMLASVARCAHCGAAMILNTGKGHRYYACSSHAKKGKTVCKGQRIRMDRLDDMVMEYLGSKVFDPDRLEQALKSYMDAHETGTAIRREQLRQMRARRGDVDAARARLFGMVETGAVDAHDPMLKERLDQMKLQAADLDSQIAALQDDLLSGVPTITPEKIRLLAAQMRERLRTGPPELRQAYMRLLLNSVVVGAEEICLSGSNAVLERLAAQGVSASASEVITFARKWR
ncbi:recombinase family protein, partial [Paramagnetospirillum marisnigri]|uniref:recombinase family protein n=1 Tax=Paramagnetospirillum marisnigri TaxID=1285242 RepID=UPI0024815B58